MISTGDLTGATDEQLESIVELQKPEVFSKVFLNMEVAHYQVKMIDLAENNSFVAILLSRQSGKTVGAAILAIRRFIFGKNEKILVIAPTENQAKNILFSKIEHILKGSKFDDMCNYQVKRITKKDRSDHSFIEWLSASPTSNIRGYTATFIIIDESQDIEDQKIFNDIYPFAATTGATIVQIGTCRGKNHFWKIFQKDSAYKKLDNITWKDVPIKKYGENKPGYVEGYIEQQKAQMPKESFAMEYECKWVEEQDMVFNYDDIAGCTGDLQKWKDGDRTKKYYGGVDFGQSPNYTVITLMSKNPVSGKFEVNYYKAMQRDYTEVVRQVVNLGLRFNIEHMIVDRTSLGIPVWDMITAAMDQLISRHHKDFNIEGLFFAPQVKLDMVDNMRVLMEQRRIMFPPFYVGELRSYRKQKLPMRGYRFYPEKGEHDDRVDSIIMAAYAAIRYEKNYSDSNSITSYDDFFAVEPIEMGGVGSEFVRVGGKWKKRIGKKEQMNDAMTVDTF